MLANLFSNTAFALLAIAITICYFYVRYVYSYWQRRGVPYAKPSFPFGNFGKNFMQKMCMGEQIDEIYRSTSEPFIGAHVVMQPTLIIRDPGLIRTMLIKDFQYFMDRGVYYDEVNDPLSGHLFSIEGERWKNLRTKLTPTFTSGKMRAIFNTLLDCKRPLQKHISEVAQSDNIVEIRDLTERHTINVIATVAFGIDVDCLAEPDTPFRVYGRKIFAHTLKNSFRFICFSICPSLMKWSGMKIIDRDVEEFLLNVTQQTLDSREKENIVRKDFFQLLVQLRNSGNVQLDDEWQTVITNKNSKTMTLNELAAQVFLFFTAGFETSSSTMTYCLFEIARNPEIQRKVHEEIDHVLAQHNGELTYDSINDLKYLESCIDETLRKYSIVQFLNRICKKDYKIPGSKVTIEKGTAILIPSFSLQRDEKYYPEPMKFDPTRFSNENKSGKSTNEMTYLPFGEGPRNCIGMRMGKMSTKVGLVSILQQHCVDIDDRHIGKEIEFSAGAFVLAPKSGVYLKFKARQQSA